MKRKSNKNDKEQEPINSKDLIVRKRKKDKNIINVIKNKVLTNWVATILLVIILIDLYVLVNIVLDKIVLPEFDFTENKVYTLSEETESKIRKLQSETTITFVNFDDYVSVIDLAEKYTILNNQIKIERIDDLTSRKDLMDEYSLDTESSVIIVASGENETMLREYDLYTYDYTTYETVDTAEEAITNAIVDVTTEDKPKIYFMSNHAQYAAEYYFSTIMHMMEEDANEVDTVDILSFGSVPEDCDTLIITTLSEDITEFERDKILEYINKGGEILLLLGPNILGKDLTNFQEILDQYGIILEDGVIYEGNTSHMLSGCPDFIVEKMQSSSLTENINMNLNVCLIDAASIKLNKDKQEELNVEYEELVYTSSKAFLRTDLTTKSISRTDSDGEENEFVVGGIINKTIDENNTSKLIILGNEIFVSDMTITLEGYKYYFIELYNNSDVVLNAIAYLNEREDIITIRKAYDAVPYTPTQLQHNIVTAIIFITPLIIVVIGIVVWQYRRRKK